MNKCSFYGRNSYIIDNPKINPTFREILLFSDSELEQWIDEMRSFVLKIWDDFGIPPLNGKTIDEIKDEFKQMHVYPVKKLQKVDELDGKDNVIQTPTTLGSCVNQFFPTMAKAKINYNTSIKEEKFSGYSVYDLFKDDHFRNRMQLGCRRHFRRDSFYKYSWSIPKGDINLGIISAKNGIDWIRNFHNYETQIFKGYNYWLCEIESDRERKGSGYTEVDLGKFLWVSKKEIEENLNFFSDTAFANLNITELNDNSQYHIRLYKYDTRIFPHGFTAFKIGYIQVAVNFPPLIAKFLYEKYTDHIKKQPIITIYDPSSGWGGRITGAMSVRDDRKIHYVGTDPNTDNLLATTDSGQTLSRYEFVAQMVNDANSDGNLAKKWMGVGTHSFHVFQEGSEEIGKHPDFQQYKGKVDFVFTSPPYFSKELYSDDPTQSATKFNTYDTWVNGFLYPTLKTCVEWLRPNRYLCWNVADVKMGAGGTYLPIEQDSCRILKELGMKYVDTLKMCLKNMPGANRVGEDGKPTAKNFCKVDGKWVKYEPISVWLKE